MRATALLSRSLGLQHARVTDFEFTDTSLILDVKPSTRTPRCSGCSCRVRKLHDRRSWTWRHLDLAGLELHLRCQLRRVDCPRCGVVVEMVPWAQPLSSFTTAFEEATAFLARRAGQSSVMRLLRVAWRTVGCIVARVAERLGVADAPVDLTHVGIDELSHRCHHESITAGLLTRSRFPAVLA